VILVTRETLHAADGEVEAQEIDVLLVPGKTEPTRVFQLLGRAGAIPPHVRDLKDTFALGLEASTRSMGCSGRRVRRMPPPQSGRWTGDDVPPARRDAARDKAAGGMERRLGADEVLNGVTSPR
jgi:hypothetical protein